MTAIEQPASVLPPGSDICLRGGVYRGRWTFNFQGTAAAPYRILAYPGEKVTFDGFGGSQLTVAMPTGNASSPVTFMVSDANAARQYAVGAYLKIDTETFQISSVNGASVTATRGAKFSCPFGTNTCPAHDANAVVTLLGDTIKLNGTYNHIFNVEVTYSGWLRRQSLYLGSAAADMEVGAAVALNGTGNRLINNDIHDTGTGVVISIPASAWLVYGNRIMNNGWVDKDGYAQYSKGIFVNSQSSGIKSTIAANIVGPSYAQALQATSSGSPLDPITVASNIIPFGKVAWGGSGQLKNQTWNGNNLYKNASLVLGSDISMPNDGLIFANNYVVGTTTFQYWTNAKIQNNSFYNHDNNQAFTVFQKLQQVVGQYSDYKFAGNTYFSPDGPAAALFNVYDVTGTPMFYTFEQRQNLFGYDVAGIEHASAPTQTTTALTRNAFDGKSANLAVNNWSGQETLTVDLTPLGWPPNTTVTLTNALNPAEQQVLTANGQVISVPMTVWSVAAPVMAASALVESPYPYYGTWRLSRQ